MADGLSTLSALPGYISSLQGLPTAYPGGSPGGASFGTTQSSGQNTSNSFIPDYSQTPILENIAQYAENMAPQVYQWGMNAYNQNQGNINSLIQQAQTYASPERIKSEMGMAEAGTMQAGEAQRQAALSDLQSYGVDPSSGRYAALDQANRVQMAAGAAGAGNQQRMATQAAGNAMLQQGISSSLQNVQTGYGAANAANQLLSTGMQLKYPSLGTTSAGTTESTGFNVGGGSSGSSSASTFPSWTTGARSGFGNVGGGVLAKGGYISPDLSPSDGAEVDDVPARLNAGEFVIPKDVTKWKGKEFFYKLIAQARKARASGQSPQQTTGYAGGGEIAQLGLHDDPNKKPSHRPMGYQDGGSVGYAYRDPPNTVRIPGTRQNPPNTVPIYANPTNPKYLLNPNHYVLGAGGNEIDPTFNIPVSQLTNPEYNRGVPGDLRDWRTGPIVNFADNSGYSPPEVADPGGVQEG
jgi:predicted negative regulator of RcsB-dependent stress response